MIYRAHLIYSPGFERPNVWRLSDDGRGIRVRMRMASGPEYPLDPSFDDLALRAHDSETWISLPMRVPDVLGRIELVLRGAPEPVAEAVREAMRPEGA